MKKILTISQAIKIAKKIHIQNKKIVLVGGCFDILHLGHIIFLEKAKKHGDILFVYVESDAAIQKAKGNRRPINTQTDRAYLLSAIRCVDYAVMLPFFSENQEYDELAKRIYPAIIATTKGDPYLVHKKRQAKITGAKLIAVTKRLAKYATSHYISKDIL